MPRRMLLFKKLQRQQKLRSVRQWQKRLIVFREKCATWLQIFALAVTEISKSDTLNLLKWDCHRSSNLGQNVCGLHITHPAARSHCTHKWTRIFRDRSENTGRWCQRICHTGSKIRKIICLHTPKKGRVRITCFGVKPLGRVFAQLYSYSVSNKCIFRGSALMSRIVVYNISTYFQTYFFSINKYHSFLSNSSL